MNFYEHQTLIGRFTFERDKAKERMFKSYKWVQVNILMQGWIKDSWKRGSYL